MRAFIFAVAAIVPALSAIDQAWAADRIPAFDIAQNCSAEVASAGIEMDTASCTKDETDAKNELAKRWPQFGASSERTDPWIRTRLLLAQFTGPV